MQKRIATLALTGLFIALGTLAVRATTGERRGVTAAPARAEQPVADASAGGPRLVHLQPFALERGFPHYWCAERPLVEAGYLVVVSATREEAARREVGEPILMLGERVIERLNDGRESGVIVGLVPAPLRRGAPALALERLPLHFAPAVLPETIDLERARGFRDAYLDAGGVLLGREGLPSTSSREAAVPVARLQNRRSVEALAAELRSMQEINR